METTILRRSKARKGIQLAQRLQTTGKDRTKAELSKKQTHNRCKETPLPFEVTPSQLNGACCARSGRGPCCHECRRPHNLNLLARCSTCNVPFCQRCLDWRHGEDFKEVTMPGLHWVCPKCRPGCGAGCEKRCCTCSICWRVSKGTQSPSNLVGKKTMKAAQAAGFCLHDYLVHLQTGEGKEAISRRKSSQAWTKPRSTSSMDARFKGKIRQTRRSKIGVTSDEKEKVNGESHELGRLDATTEMDVGTTGRTFPDCLGVVHDLPVDVYLLSLWLTRRKEVSGNSLSITLSDKEVEQTKAIKKRSLFHGIEHIFNPTNFRDLDRDEKQAMTKSLKDCLLSHINDCDLRVKRFCEELESMI